MNRFNVKFLIFSLLLGATLSLPFYSAQAQVASVPTAEVPLSPLSIAATETQISIGLPYSGFASITALRESAEASCRPILTSFESLSSTALVADSSTSAVLSVIGGGTIEAVKTSALIKAAVTAKACVDIYVDKLRRTSGTLNMQEELAREQDKFTKISGVLQQNIQDLNARQNASVKDIAKAFMVKLVSSIATNLTTEVVNNMVEKYKISDYLAYGDAVSSQIYSMKYINEHFQGQTRDQMMIRSILQSDKFPEKIKTAQTFANSKAQEYLGNACSVGNAGINPSDDNVFLKCLAAYGAPQASAQYQYLQAFDQAQAANAAAKATAQQELSQSDGFAPPRDCSGSLTLQNQIDNQFDQAAVEKSVREIAKVRSSQLLKQGKLSQADYDKAVAAADQATANAKALENQTKNPIIDICKAIDSPASFVSKGIGDFLQGHLTSATDLKTDNLPFYATFLSDVASNFLTNILTGKKSTSQVFKEAGAGALQGAIIGFNQNGSGDTTNINPVGNVNIYAQANGTGPQTANLVAGQNYVITIDFSDIADEGLNRVLVSGVNGTQNAPLTQADLNAKKVQFDFSPTSASGSGFTLRVTFFGPQPQEQGGEKQIGPYERTFTISQVAGATTILPRGPLPPIR